MLKKSGYAAGPYLPGDGRFVSTAIVELTPIVAVKAACEALNIPRASFYRKRGCSVFPVAAAVRFIPRALDSEERGAVLACLYEERFQNCAPAPVYAMILDEGSYHCSIRTMYRILQGEGESAEPAKRLIADTRAKQSIEPGKLTIHPDQVSSMTAKPVAFLIADLGITKTHSHPYVSDDNPIFGKTFPNSEIQAGIPGMFRIPPGLPWLFRESSLPTTKSTGIPDWACFPRVAHRSLVPAAIQQHRVILDPAYVALPERFVRKPPQALPAPTEIWINKPLQTPANKTQ